MGAQPRPPQPLTWHTPGDRCCCIPSTAAGHVPHSRSPTDPPVRREEGEASNEMLFLQKP